jgi:hypothetical protein
MPEFEWKNGQNRSLQGMPPAKYDNNKTHKSNQDLFNGHQAMERQKEEQRRQENLNRQKPR